MIIAIVTNSQTKFAKTACSFLIALVCTLAIMVVGVFMSSAALDVALVRAIFAVATTTFAIATALLIAVVIGDSSVTVREAIQKTLIVFLVACIAYGVSRLTGMF